MPFPTPDTFHPIKLRDGTEHRGTVFLKTALDHPCIEVGDYTYMSSHQPLEEPADIAQRLAPYLLDFAPERLVIGKFCQFAHGVRFITSSANHDMTGFSTYPFRNFMMTEETSDEELRNVFGLAITITTTARTRDEGTALFEHLGIPFAKTS